MIQAWMIWNLCNMENKIISVERILQYTCIPCEPSLVVDDNRPDPSWPSYGEVDIQDLKVVLSIYAINTFIFVHCTTSHSLHQHVTNNNHNNIIRNYSEMVRSLAQERKKRG